MDNLAFKSLDQPADVNIGAFKVSSGTIPVRVSLRNLCL